MKYALLLSLFLAACGTVTGSVKVYSVQPSQGLVRKQVDPADVVPFSKAKGYLCESPAHFSDTVACTGGAVKVYYLDPARGGLWRKQASELIPYANAKGYLCASPPDFQAILDNCTSKRP